MGTLPEGIRARAVIEERNQAEGHHGSGTMLVSVVGHFSDCATIPQQDGLPHFALGYTVERLAGILEHHGSDDTEKQEALLSAAAALRKVLEMYEPRIEIVDFKQPENPAEGD